MENLQIIANFFQFNSGLDIEIIKIVFVFSLVISLITFHKRQNVPVGIIAPGILLLLIGYPIKLFLVVIISLLVFICARLLQHYVFSNTVISNREKLLLYVLLSAIFSFISYLIFHQRFDDIFMMGTIGIVLPAMIVDNLTNVHKRESIKAFLISSIITIFTFIIFKVMAHELLPISYKYYLDILYLQRYTPSHVLNLLMYLLFGIGIIYNIILYRKYKLESVGLLLGAYLGLLVFRPSQILFFVSVTLISYFIVYFIHKHTLTFGYRIFVLASIVVTLVYSVLERIGFTLSKGTFHPFYGIYVAGMLAGIIICSLIVSEAIKHGYKKIASVSTLMTFILAGTLYIVQMFGGIFGYNFTIASLVQDNEASINIQTEKITSKNHSDPKFELDTKYVEQAKDGESHYLMARRAIEKYENENGLKLHHFQKLYVETLLVQEDPQDELHTGDTLKFSAIKISKLITDSENLDQDSINIWNSF